MDYTDIQKELGAIIEGEVSTDEKIRSKYSTDASIFEVMPALIAYPKHGSDIEKIVSYVSSKKASVPGLSVTARAAGTCMSGGSLNTSIIIDTTKYMNTIDEVSDEGTISVEPGAFYRDMEMKTLAKRLILPSYTASKQLCAVGGMVANNSSGEMTLTYGDTARYVKSLDIVLADGKTYTLSAQTHAELDKKLRQKDYEGDLYRNIVDLITENFELITKAKPKVSKNSSGYLLWRLWNHNSLNLAWLMCGAQGTLGIITRITFNLVPIRTARVLVVMEIRELAVLPMLVNTVLSFRPECFESYDQHTYALAEKYLPEITQHVLTDKASALTLIAEFAADSEADAVREAERAIRGIRDHGIEAQLVRHPDAQDHYWTIRRSSFALLKDHAGEHERTAPFIDDIIVKPETLPKFLPRLQSILSEYNMIYTIAGHIGNGNFHLIPLVNMEEDKAADTILELSRRVFSLVFEYGGSMAGEHNDGIIRTPFVKDMYGPEVYSLFQKVKEIFDPLNIFNPGKKVGGTIEYAKAHISKKSTNKHI